MLSKKLRWFGTAALVAGLFAVAPITANAADRANPKPAPTPTGFPMGPTCTGWTGTISTITAAEGRSVTVTGTIQAEAGSDGGPCLATAQLTGYDADFHGQWTWSRKAQVIGIEISRLGEFSVTLPYPIEIDALCVSGTPTEAVACAGAGYTDAGDSPGTPYHVRPMNLPADQTGIWHETDPNCGTCV